MTELHNLKHEEFRVRQAGATTLPRASALRVNIDAPCGARHKRAFDVMLASLSIVILSPLLIGLAVAIRLSDGGPAFFGHSRVGYSGVPFNCWKFRSMRPNSEALLDEYLLANPIAARQWQNHRKLRHDPRVTPLGRILRKYSVDELPQLFNILAGEMSFVGPRPIEAAELEKFGLSLRHYLRARPGLTGLWQVSGRSSLDYQRRVVLDRYYVMHWSLLLDVMLIFKTVPVAMGARGAY